MSTDTADITKDSQTAADAIEKAIADPNASTVINVISPAEEVEKDFAPLVPAVVKETKAGYKTTEFWVGILSTALIAFGAIPTPHDAKGWVVAAIVVAYIVARGLAKQGIPSVEEPTE